MYNRVMWLCVTELVIWDHEMFLKQKTFLMLLQEVLGAEGISLQFRHICSHLLWCCAIPNIPKNNNNTNSTISDAYEELLHQVIVVTGFFAVDNTENQVRIYNRYSIHNYTENLENNFS